MGVKSYCENAGHPAYRGVLCPLCEAEHRKGRRACLAMLALLATAPFGWLAWRGSTPTLKRVERWNKETGLWEVIRMQHLCKGDLFRTDDEQEQFQATSTPQMKGNVWSIEALPKER